MCRFLRISQARARNVNIGHRVLFDAGDCRQSSLRGTDNFYVSNLANRPVTPTRVGLAHYATSAVTRVLLLARETVGRVEEIVDTQQAEVTTALGHRDPRAVSFEHQRERVLE